MCVAKSREILKLLKIFWEWSRHITKPRVCITGKAKSYKLENHSELSYSGD